MILGASSRSNPSGHRTLSAATFAAAMTIATNWPLVTVRAYSVRMGRFRGDIFPICRQDTDIRVGESRIAILKPVEER